MFFTLLPVIRETVIEQKWLFSVGFPMFLTSKPLSLVLYRVCAVPRSNSDTDRHESHRRTDGVVARMKGLERTTEV